MEYPRKRWNPPILGYLQMRFSKIISLFSLHIGPWASQNLHMTCEHTPGWFTFSWTSKCCQLNTKGWWINTLKRNYLAPIWRCWLAGIFKISKDDTKADAGRRLMRAAVISLWCLAFVKRMARLFSSWFKVAEGWSPQNAFTFLDILHRYPK